MGVSRDAIRCRSLLSKYSTPIKNLEHKIEQAKNIRQVPEFQNGIFRRFLEQGHFNVFDFSQIYREEQRSYEAELRYQSEIGTMGCVIGDDHLLVQELRLQLSLLMRSEGRLKEAEKLQVQMIELHERVKNGSQYTERFASYLASIYWDLGRWDEAEELQVKVMETSQRVLGMEHRSTLTSLANLASTYRSQGRWKDAEDLEVQVMETSKRVLGIEHPDTLTSIANLASTYMNQGRWKEAEELQVQVMETRNRLR